MPDAATIASGVWANISGDIVDVVESPEAVRFYVSEGWRFVARAEMELARWDLTAARATVRLIEQGVAAVEAFVATRSDELAYDLREAFLGLKSALFTLNMRLWLRTHWKELLVTGVLGVAAVVAWKVV